MFWLLALLPLSQADVPGLTFSVSSDMVNEGIQSFTPYLIDLLDSVTVPVIYEEFKVALIKVKANLTDFSLHDVKVDLGETSVDFQTPNLVRFKTSGISFKAYTAYNVRYGLLDYADKNCTVTTSKASLDVTVALSETSVDKPQFTVKSIKLKLGKLHVATHKWYNGTINGFIKINKGIIESIIEGHIKTAVKGLDKTLEELDWTVEVPKTGVKVDLRYFGAPSVANSTLYLPINGTFYS